MDPTPPPSPTPPGPAQPPSPAYGPTPGTIQKTAEHVRLLGILTWVYAGLQGIGVLFGLVYMVVGLIFVANPPGRSSSMQGGLSPELFGWVFFASGALTVVFVGTFMVLSMLGARDLMRHRRRVFCLVMACVHCLSVPFGTVLGIFTIVVLSRPEAKALFEQRG